MTRKTRSKAKDTLLSEVLRIQPSGKMGISIQLCFLSGTRQLRNYRTGSLGCVNSTYSKGARYSRTGYMIHGIWYSIMLPLEGISGIRKVSSTHGKLSYQKTW